MPVVLESPWGFRERVILFGAGGSGKTNAILKILERTTGKFWILDNDISAAYGRALETDFAHVPMERFEIIELDGGWNEFVEKLNYVLEHADPKNDWIVVDSATPTWDDAQSWFTETTMDMTYAEYVAKVRAETSNVSDFSKVLAADGRWTIINKEYFEKFYGALKRWKGHFILTAEVTALGKDADETERELFGHLGVFPKGQKRLHYIGHTTILLSKRAKGAYTATTIKDRNREEMEYFEYGDDFAIGYLKNIAGWKAKVVKDTPVEVVAEG